MYHRHGLNGKCGVYLLTCLVNGKRYVGASVNMGQRIAQHFSKTCIQKYARINSLYRDIETYGRDGFDVKCLEICTPSAKLETERKWYHIISPEYNLVEPDECPFRHPEVREKAKAASTTEECIHKMLMNHRSQQYRDKCREVQRHRMIPCAAIDDTDTYQFESLTSAAKWLHRDSALASVVTNITDAIKRNGTAYGYKWEVIERENPA